MPSTFSPNKGYELMATGENQNTWGIRTNANLSIVDLNLGGRYSPNVSGSSDFVVSDNDAENLYHTLTGVLTGNINYELPDAGGDYIIYNNTTGAFTLTVRPQSGGAGIVVPQGRTLRIFINPTTGTAVSAGEARLATDGGLQYTSGELGLGITTTRGDLIVRGASFNTRLPIGVANTLLGSDGTDPSWRTLTSLLDSALSSTQGAILYRGASAWAALGPGSSGQVLTTQGAAQDPLWAAAGLSAASASEIWTGTENGKAITPLGMLTALAPTTISDAATITMDLNAGINFATSIGADRVLAISNYSDKVGRTGRIRVVESGAARLLNVSNAPFDFVSGVPFVLGVGSGAVHYIYYEVVTATSVLLSVARNVL